MTAAPPAARSPLRYVGVTRASQILRCSKHHVTSLLKGDPPAFPCLTTPQGPQIAVADLLDYAREKGISVAPADRLPPPLSVSQIAAIFGTSIRYVETRIKKGDLLALKLPGGRGDFRVRWTDLVAFARTHHLPLSLLEDGAARHVLVVGAGPVWSEHLRRSLPIDEGWTVAVAGDLLHAGIITATAYPEAIVFDAAMTDCDPSYLVGRWREHGCRLAIALAQEDDDRPAKLIRAGFDVALRKPVDHQRVAELIRERLSAAAAA